ncbi:MAG: PD-(D/E)XK nuclease family protein [Gammaproteobacteria bacterium]|nr:PD-(D/E)XK nuclease family protein [Gammaproteobacteria bacterium]
MNDTFYGLDTDDLLLTVNNRLAGELRERYDARQAAAGLKVWTSPTILPWNVWLRSRYDQLLDSGACDLELLTPSQEHLLWHDIIAADPGTGGLLRPAAAARLASEANQRLLDWQVDEQRLQALGGDDTQRFLAWKRHFDRRLDDQRLACSARLLALLTAAINDGRLDPPGRLHLAGFESLSPAQTGLLRALADAGSVVTHFEPPRQQTATTRRIGASDDEQETRLAAAWARDYLAQHPDRRIAIVCPDLQRRRGQVERILATVLAPADYVHGRAGAARFNLSLGEPLSARPLSAHALLALRLLNGSLALDDIGELLRSPFIGGHDGEWEQRALLDVVLRQTRRPQLDLSYLAARLRLSSADDVWHCPDLAARLDALHAIGSDMPATDTPSHWAVALLRALRVLGWPGDHALDSHEYQEHERARNAFGTLAELGRVRARLRRGEAIEQLQRIFAETVFQPQSPASSLQVLGPLEAAGIAFDAVWLLGADDETWPPSPSPHPLLPTGLQRELDMPHASAARELAFAQRVTGRLLASSAEVVASFARRDGDRDRRPSPLIVDWPEHEVPTGDGNAIDVMTLACWDPGHLEPLPAASRARSPDTVRGGTALLSAQAGCPFKAMARFRLDAGPLAEACQAPDGALNGNVVHDLMLAVWTEIGDSDGLAALDSDQRTALIERHARHVMQDYARQRPDLYTARFIDLECSRLADLVGDWLARESERGQAFAIDSLEREQLIRIGPLQLDTRIDRIDRLADGSLAIIDYKTGQPVGCEGWLDERLTEPQLPAYCVSAGLSVSATVLANLSREPRQRGFSGISRDPGFARGVATAGDDTVVSDWDQLTAHWQTALTDLAVEFDQGRVEPTPSELACRYCDFGDLCRVRELVVDDGADNDTGNDDE